MNAALRSAISFWITKPMMATRIPAPIAIRRIFLSTLYCSPPNQARSTRMTTTRIRVGAPLANAFMRNVPSLFQDVDHVLRRRPQEGRQEDEHKNHHEAARGGHEPRRKGLHAAGKRAGAL